MWPELATLLKAGDKDELSLLPEWTGHPEDDDDDVEDEDDEEDDDEDEDSAM